ncbi:MAG: hypothetical protein FWH54_06905, partial [Methanobrevibacter sp.]|nr:hypothetical protein [Methanobrevibacter sp.]
MSLIKNHKSMISLNLSLTVPQYEDLNNYIEMWKEKTGLDLSVESFLMGNVYYWTHEETGKRKQTNEEDLNNI